MIEPGQELTDPASGAHLLFHSTSSSTSGDCVAMELTVEAEWSAGPLHLHPCQTERLRVRGGRFRAQVGRQALELLSGDEIEVPPATSHTIELVDARGALDVTFRPALRTDELFETMFAARFPRRPPEFVPSALRAWVESRGFHAEIRYLWPRRVALAGVCLLLLLATTARATLDIPASRRRRRVRPAQRGVAQSATGHPLLKGKPPLARRQRNWATLAGRDVRRAAHRFLNLPGDYFGKRELSAKWKLSVLSGRVRRSP